MSLEDNRVGVCVEGVMMEREGGGRMEGWGGAGGVRRKGVKGKGMRGEGRVEGVYIPVRSFAPLPLPNFFHNQQDMKDRERGWLG